MLQKLRAHRSSQLVIGLIIGVFFGFFLQKSGVTEYDVIINQLLLKDFIVLKVMLTAIITGTIGVHALRSLGLTQLHPKPGSVGQNVIGGLLFGVGFAVLGYCPGTIAGAVGQGQLDALVGGVGGILLGAGIFAALYPRMERPILLLGDFGKVTLPEVLKVNAWAVVVPAVIVLIGALLLLERAGL
jgi:hypothetical protein